nr:TPA_asm: polymerase PB1 [Diachasmavirus orthomyxi]
MEFRHKCNSLFLATFIQKEEHHRFESECHCPSDKVSNNIGMISALYMYTNTPPLASGTQGPKVAESVLRAYSYNKKLDPEKKKMDWRGRKIERLHWEKCDGDFPIDEVHGNFSAVDVKNMSCWFLKKNFFEIREAMIKAVSNALFRNSDNLTTGKQTSCCLTDQSVPASVAYKRFYHFLKSNTGRETMSHMDWIAACVECFEAKSINVLERIEEKKTVRRYDRTTKQKVFVTRTNYKWTSKTIHQEEEIKDYLIDTYSKFESYLKTKERGKLEKRAIASPNMFFRALLKIVEDMHLELGKKIPGSTISIGGDEKKRKITMNLLETDLETGPAPFSVQGTEDATKWNECVSPGAFCVMHKTFVDPEVRKVMRLEAPTEHEIIFGKIAELLHFFQSIKRVKMGPGPLGFSPGVSRRLDWEKDPLDFFNNKTRSWLEEARKIMKGNYLLSSCGMLMGMMNAASTTLGLLATNYTLDQRLSKVVTLRSSDDSASMYLGASSDYGADAYYKNKKSMALLGINLSGAKTLLFVRGYGEYTSWYFDVKFASQFGVESSALRPQGKNPHDDFYAIAASTAVSLNSLQNNCIGAAARLVIGISNVRRLYRIVRDPTKREGISPSVLLLSDGGDNPWHCSNCSLQEIPLKELAAKEEKEKEYLLKIMNPNNPFSGEAEEEITYSRDKGTLISIYNEIPRNLFTWIKRSNRTVRSKDKGDLFDDEKANAEALEIIRLADPTVYLEYPKTKSKVSKHIMGMMHILRSGCSLSESEEAAYAEALDVLHGAVFEENEAEDTNEITMYDLV